jgi:hypothetical protein
MGIVRKQTCCSFVRFGFDDRIIVQVISRIRNALRCHALGLAQRRASFDEVLCMRCARADPGPDPPGACGRTPPASAAEAHPAQASGCAQSRPPLSPGNARRSKGRRLPLRSSLAQPRLGADWRRNARCGSVFFTPVAFGQPFRLHGQVELLVIFGGGCPCRYEL